MKSDLCKCGHLIEKHTITKLCNNCYKIKRLEDHKKRDDLKIKTDSSHLVKRSEYKKQYYHRVVVPNKKIKYCKCGQPALKQSIYGFCKTCSEQARYKKKIQRQIKQKKEKLQLRLRSNLSGRLRAIKNGNIKANDSIVDWLDCSIVDLIAFIKTKFYDNPITGIPMSWDNYGHKTWHIDHIVPLRLAQSDDEIRKLFNYENLQPLWKEDHIEKTADENKRFAKGKI